jgi:hypothetical protein
MQKQFLITRAVLMGLVFLFAGHAWAEDERVRGHRGNQQLQDQAAGDHFRSRGAETADIVPDRDRPRQDQEIQHDRPGRRWAPSHNRHARGHQERRWHRRGLHDRPQHHYRPHRQPHRDRHWQPRPHHRRPAHQRRWHRGRHAWQPVIEKHVYHYADQAESDTLAAETFELAASVNGPAGGSFSIGISRSE